jgi:hypothetical protein
MDSDRKESQLARRALENASGTVLRATRRGALVLETENARRMMRRFAKLRPDAEQDGIDDAGTAPAQP